MYCPCAAHVLPMCCPCTTHVLPMYCPCEDLNSSLVALLWYVAAASWLRCCGPRAEHCTHNWCLCSKALVCIDSRQASSVSIVTVQVNAVHSPTGCYTCRDTAVSLAPDCWSLSEQCGADGQQAAAGCCSISCEDETDRILVMLAAGCLP